MRLTKAEANDKRIVLEGRYNMVLENDSEKHKTELGIADFALIFRSKEDVLAHIAMLNIALEFWVYDEEKGK